jgi:hypothetical protein
MMADENVVVEPEEDKDVEVEVVDDTPPEDKVAARDQDAAADFDISEDEIGQYSDRVQKRIKRLKYEFHEQRRAKETAERQGQEAVAHTQRMMGENTQLKELLKRGNEALYNATQSKSETELSSAEKDFREAYDAGDTDRIVEAQRRVNEALYEKRSVEDLRPLPEEAVAVQNQQVAQRVQQTQQTLDPRGIQWLRDNPWFGKQGDEEMTAFAYGVGAKLETQGVDPRVEPDRYYSAIDERLKTVFPDYFDGAPVREQAPRKSVVAPATRGGKSPRKVTLTSTQMDLAKKLGVTPEQYAQEVAKQEMAHG